MDEDIGTHEVENHQPDTLEKQIEHMIDEDIGAQEEQQELVETDIETNATEKTGV